VPGYDVGAVYESAARLDVGGDVYDFLELDDGRVAIVLGDVTGHGVDATADMAMAKFVFRSLAREHPEPADFLAHANEVIAGEIVTGKFITMAYLALHPTGRLACASAGHPAPRLVQEDGTVEELSCGGLALGIDGGQVYEQLDAMLAPGAAVVLYTDGVVEARSGGELYGVERLDACLSGRAGLPAQALAAAVLADCRAFAGGELRDDCAIVVARRT
jgi:serine phosphatase RsbU (regulator of sigma subunit)